MLDKIGGVVCLIAIVILLLSILLKYIKIAEIEKEE
jgi:hypothetical protein